MFGAYHESEYTRESGEMPEKIQKLKDTREKEVFAAFNWDPAEFRRKSNEYYYQEFLEKQSVEFEGEIAAYGGSELYHFSLETFLMEGPNCYAFAMKLPVDPITKLPYQIRPVPGEFSHGSDRNFHEKTSEILNFGSSQEQKMYFTEMMQDDARALGMNLKEVDKEYEPEEGEWMIALVATDNVIDNPNAIRDFHFYRKGEEGVWYHKPGTNQVENTDAEGKLIFDPGECSRGCYNQFLGYYAVSRKYNEGRE